MKHVPVLLNEVLEMVNPKPGDFIIDGTVGEGGHGKEIIKRIEPKGMFLGIDWDESQAKRARENIISKNAKVVIIQGNYRNIPGIQKKEGLPKADGLLLDLGFSSAHLLSGRGFSFQRDEPLDMRYDEKAGGESAKDVINKYAERALAEIFWKYGEEKKAREFAKHISEERKKRPIDTTGVLVRIIGEKKTSKIHPATKIFQALRIYINKELENLESVLGNIPEILKPGGRVAIITFHSLEDRVVKQYFKTFEEQGVGKRINKKVIKPTREEVLQNPRSRSAKLRGFQI